MIKHLFAILGLSICLVGCNMNPNKEARIQTLETELQEAIDKLVTLEVRIQSLENEQEQMKTSSLKLEEE